MEDKLTVIKNGSIVKRIFALIMDGAVALFVFFGLAFLVFSPIASKCFHYNELHDEAEKKQLDSHLYIKIKEDDKSNVGIYSLKEQYLDEYKEDLNIEDKVGFLKEKLHYYYLNFKTGNVEEGCYYSENFDKPIKLESGEEILPVNYYTEDWFNENIGGLQTVSQVLDAALVATEDFFVEFRPLQNQIKYRELFIILPPFVISYGVFFFLVPLLFKNGETFGKKTLNLGFATKDGYKVQKRQIVTRQLFIFVLVVFGAFGIGIGTTSFAILFAGIAIYVLATALSKSKRSVADFLAYTLLINTRDSVWFENPQVEAEKEQEVKDQMSKYNKYIPENKNLLQVGTEIVDEEAKKEFLESQKKTTKSEK